MTAAKTQTQTKQTRDNNTLVLYRLDNVEQALKDLTSKVDKQDNVKKSDITELRDAIIERIVNMRTDLQKQIDEKADKQELTDFKKQMASYGAIVLVLSVAIFTFMLSRLK